MERNRKEINNSLLSRVVGELVGLSSTTRRLPHPPVTAASIMQYYQFGKAAVNAKTIFYKTNLSLAMVNRCCVLPGHVLVYPIRVAKRYSDLSSEEVCDIFLTVQKVQKVIETVHKANSSSIAIQDGKDAGQTVQHFHVHIIPRKPDDFKNKDEFYEKLYGHDKDKRKQRDEREMIEEAEYLRSFFV